MGNILEELRGSGRSRRSPSRPSSSDAYLAGLRTSDEDKTTMTDAAREWGKQTARRLRAQVNALGLHEKVQVARQVTRIRILKGGTILKEPPLAESVGVRVRQQFGIPSRIDFPFVRHGIFVEHGVGRNRFKGSGMERPRPWLKPVLDSSLDGLASALADAGAAGVISDMKFVIPGILDRRVKISNNG